MPDFSFLISETYRNISSGFMETLIQNQREDLFTGLMRMSYPTGENLIFSFLEGTQQKLYRCHENAIEAPPRHTWADALDHRNASVGFLRLSVEAMRFARIAYEAPVLRIENSAFTSGELTDAAGEWAAAQDPGIVHVQSETVNRYYLIAGHAAPLIEELSFVEGEAHFSLVDTSFPRTLPKTDYQVLRYVSNCEHEAWHEYELRLAFNPLMRMLINRFSELAGRVLTERLCEQLSRWAREGGWNIIVTINGAVNHHYFDSLESAVGVYGDLLRLFRQEASPAIGPRMVDDISRESLIKLDPYRRGLLTQHI